MKAKKGEVAKITVAIPVNMLESLDRMAESDHRSRSGQVQFFLAKEVARRASASEELKTATE